MRSAPRAAAWPTVLSAVLLVALAACRQPPAAAPAVAEQPAAAPPPVDLVAEEADLKLGIDVSVHSGAVDWQRLKADGHHFAFAKASEGVDLKDPAFADHWPRIKEAGLLRGAYHFFVTEDDPAAQADLFLSVVDLEPGDLAPVVDIETVGRGTKPGIADRLHVWLDRVEKRWGVKPIIYTTASFWDAHLSGDFGGYPLWVAEYGVEAPRLPSGWQKWHLWQWRGDAVVPGVEKSVDLSRINHRDVDLLALLVPSPAAPGATPAAEAPEKIE